MTSTETVLGLEKNPYKQMVRNMILDIMKDELPADIAPKGISLCGASCKFERQVVNAFPNARTVCIEQTPDTLKRLRHMMPKGCKLYDGDWFDTDTEDFFTDSNAGKSVFPNMFGNDPDANVIHWQYFDSCSFATPYLLHKVLHNRLQNLTWIYALTLDLRCRKYGADGTKEWLLESMEPWCKAKKSIEKSQNGTFGLIQAIVKFLTQKASYHQWARVAPHTVVYYPGGKNEVNPCIPMVTMVFVDGHNEIKNQSWSWKRPMGYAGVRYIDLFNVKKGLTTIDQELTIQKVKVVNQVKGKTMKAKDPKMVAAGKKAWETRKKNEQAKKNREAGIKAAQTRKENEQAKKYSEAGKKAWATRRKNAAKH